MIFKKGDYTSGQYKTQIIDCLEVGPNSELYLGKLSGTELDLAIKVGGNMIQKECELLRSLRHPGIVRVLDFVYADGFCYIVMPYYRGMTLEALVQQRGKLLEDHVLFIAKSLCEILCYMQERDKPVLHNDIKPSNILLKEEGGIVLLDFGLASYEGGKQEDVLFQGSLGYAAPECWHQRERSLSKATDVFAFGATIYRLLTGEKPSEHYGTFIVSDACLRKRWQLLIKKCCTLEAEDRYQNAAQILDALQEIRIK